MIPLPPPIICEVVKVHDGDTLICADRIRIRIAGINAPELSSSPSCRRPSADYLCDNARARRSQAIVSALVLHKRLTCREVGRSYRRTVAICRLPDGRDLSCAAIAAGAAVRWGRYWRKYGMGECR